MLSADDFAGCLFRRLLVSVAFGAPSSPAFRPSVEPRSVARDVLEVHRVPEVDAPVEALVDP